MKLSGQWHKSDRNFLYNHYIHCCLFIYCYIFQMMYFTWIIHISNLKMISFKQRELVLVASQLESDLINQSINQSNGEEQRMHFFGWCGSASLIQDHSDHNTSKELMNQWPGWICWFPWCAWSEWSRITDPSSDHSKGTTHIQRPSKWDIQL